MEKLALMSARERRRDIVENDGTTWYFSFLLEERDVMGTWCAQIESIREGKHDRATVFPFC